MRVLFFGALRDQLGPSREMTPAPADVTHLWEVLTQDRPHLHGHHGVRVARNLTYCGWDTPLHEDDEVAFMPPLCGG